jgi:hypothetical protein
MKAVPEENPYGRRRCKTCDMKVSGNLHNMFNFLTQFYLDLSTAINCTLPFQRYALRECLYSVLC